MTTEGEVLATSIEVDEYIDTHAASLAMAAVIRIWMQTASEEILYEFGWPDWWTKRITRTSNQMLVDESGASMLVHGAMLTIGAIKQRVKDNFRHRLLFLRMDEDDNIQSAHGVDVMRPEQLN